MKVLDLYATGHTVTQISASLQVLSHTVTRRARAAAVKLGAQTVIEAVVKYDRLKRG